MHRFKDILVGVDLAVGQVPAELPATSLEALSRAQWLAKTNDARLTILYVLDLSDTEAELINDSEDGIDYVMAAVTNRLEELAASAVADRIVTDSTVVVGRSWIEIIRKVLRDRHDLVVAGTRHVRSLEDILIGSTGTKLLRKCPSPVWITKPQPEAGISSILVAHCQRPVGDTAMELGCSMAELHGAQLHVVHSLEFPEYDSAFPARISAEKSAQFRSNARRHIEKQLTKFTFARPPQVHILTESPDFAILDQIRRNKVELLVMGTIARTGISGFVTGNTAERLLPRIPCSVLAVKPPGFVSPISLE